MSAVVEETSAGRGAVDPPALELLGLTKRYGDRSVVHDLTFSVASGTRLCLLGRNGAGKTTTLHMLMGLRNPTSGDARLLGVGLASSEIHDARRRVGYLPDTPVLYPHLTGREHLEMIVALHGAGPDGSERIARGLRDLDLGDAADAPVRTYSAGMKKRVAFLAATVHDPEVLILDEPTGTLDVASAHAVKSAMLEMRDRGRAVLFTTHVLEMAERHADELAILDGGRLRFVGTLDELHRRHGRGGPESLEDLFLRVTAPGESAEPRPGRRVS